MIVAGRVTQAWWEAGRAVVRSWGEEGRNFGVGPFHSGSMGMSITERDPPADWRWAKRVDYCHEAARCR